MAKAKAGIWAVIMAGGDGERLWPLSTAANPKQFLRIFGGRSLIGQALDRLAGLVPAERTLVVTADRFVRRTREELPALGCDQVIGEPCRRNTAAAVALACREVRRRAGEDALVMILTADHLIGPAAAFRATLREALRAAAAADDIVTIGIRPTVPATGFGYIDTRAKPPRFVEKPSLDRARRYLKRGGFVWNSGMFIFRVRTMLAAFANHAPAYLKLVDASRPRQVYPKLESIAIDYAVMEKAKNLKVVPSRFDWDDVGAWTALAAHFPADKRGNVTLGKAWLEDCEGAVVCSDAPGLTAVIGLRDVVVVRVGGSTLVAAKSQLSAIRRVAAAAGGDNRR